MDRLTKGSILNMCGLSKVKPQISMTANIQNHKFINTTFNITLQIRNGTFKITFSHISHKLCTNNN